MAIWCGAEAQVKVDGSNGHVGIGGDISTHSKSKLRVLNGGYEFQFKPNNPTPEIGVNYSYINFWHSTWGWHELHAELFHKVSDSTLKENIRPLENATDILKRLKTYSYYYKNDMQTTKKKDYGVLAQELETVLPDLVSTVQLEEGQENKVVNYDGFIAFLIKGFNEQQTVIETQQKEIGILQNIVFGQELDLTELHELRDKVKELQILISKCCNNVTIPRNDTIVAPNKMKVEAVLYQNTPNPFSANTEISCDIPTMNNSAFIYVYNLQGVELMSFPIARTGFNTVSVSASVLPAGMYLYTLVVDNQIVDTKRMILTK